MRIPRGPGPFRKGTRSLLDTHRALQLYITRSQCYSGFAIIEKHAKTKSYFAIYLPL